MKQYIRSQRLWSSDCGWLENVILEIVDGRIHEIKHQQNGEFPATILLPGFVNTHCHLELGQLQGKLPKDKPFPEWVSLLRQETKDWTLEEYKKGVNKGIQESLASGVTTLVDVGNTPAHFVLQENIRLWALAEVLGKNPAVAQERFDWAKDSLKTSTKWVYQGLAGHAPYSNSAEILRLVAAHCQNDCKPLFLHVDESPEEHLFFTQKTGKLWDFTQNIYPDLTVPDNVINATDWLLSEDLLPEGSVLVHGNYLQKDQFAKLHAHKISVVHCPRSTAFFNYPKRLNLKEAIEHGVNICLGTDSLASNDSLHFWEEVQILAQRNEFSLEELLTMATSNGALALALPETGTLTEGNYFDAQRIDGIELSLFELQNKTPKVLNTWVMGKSSFQGNSDVE